jgi:hypothetical protein
VAPSKNKIKTKYFFPIMILFLFSHKFIIIKVIELFKYLKYLEASLCSYSQQIGASQFVD